MILLRLKAFAMLIVGAFLFFPAACLALEKVTLQLPWHHQFNFAGYYVAKEMGYYSDAGLDVTLREVKKGSNAVEEVISGRSDFGISGSGLLVSRSDGKPVVIVASFFQRNPTVLMTLKSSGIQTPQDLAGKKVMLPPGQRAASLIALMQQEKVLDQIEIIDPAFGLKPLISGDVDAIKVYRTNEPYAIHQKGYDVHIINPEDYGIDFLGDSLFTSERMVQERADVVEKFRQASIRGWSYALDHLEETADLIQARYKTEKSIDQLRFEAREVLSVVEPDLIPIGTTGLSRWAQMTHHMIAIGSVPPQFHIPESFIFSPPETLDWKKLFPLLSGVAVVIVALLLILAFIAGANRRLRMAQQQLETSERKYRDVINNQKDVLLLHKVIPNEYAKFSEVNDAAVNFYGYSREELLNLSPHDIVLPEIIDEVVASGRREEMLETGELFVESVHVTKSGEQIPVEVSATIVEIEGEKYILSNVRDIRDRKKSEDALRDSERKFRLLADYTTDWEYWIDQEGNYAYISPACEDITGYKPTELSDDPSLFVSLIQDEISAEHFTQNEQQVGSQCSLEFQIKTKSGETRWIEHNCREITDTEGTFLGRRGNNRDITLRRQAEDKFSLLFKEAVVGLVLADVETGEILECNDVMAKMVGWDPEELIGQTQAIWHAKEDIEGSMSKGFDETRKGDFNNFRYEKFVTKTGKLFDVEIKAKPLVLADRKVLLGIINDVSERNELEHQLRQKHKMEAVGYMAGGMAHNFNNNLSIILGNLDLVQMQQSAESNLTPLLENAKTAVRRSRDLVRKIITYSRQGLQEKAHISLNGIVNETVSLLRSTYPSTVQLHCQCSTDGELATISADESQIQEALVNLCNNAVDSMEEDGDLLLQLEAVTLEKSEIPAQFDVSPGRFLKLSVQDSGCGMDVTTQQRVFDPFFTTKEMFEGAGMGLATVQGIVAQHDGVITVDSAPGQGTTFNLFFPIVGLASSVVEGRSVSEPLEGTERIFFVDDDPMVAEVVDQMLKKMGYQVTTMTDSEEALKFFTVNKDHFDLLFTDQTMPGVTGLELIEKALELKPGLPTILFTGYSTKVNEEDARSRGVSAFVLKPLDLTEMLKTIRSVLDEVE